MLLTLLDVINLFLPLWANTNQVKATIKSWNKVFFISITFLFLSFTKRNKEIASVYQWYPEFHCWWPNKLDVTKSCFCLLIHFSIRCQKFYCEGRQPFQWAPVMNWPIQTWCLCAFIPKLMLGEYCDSQYHTNGNHALIQWVVSAVLCIF